MKAELTDFLVSTGRIQREQLQLISREDWLSREPIGRLALLHGLLSAADIDEILNRQLTDHRLFGEIAIQLGMLTSEQLDILYKGQSVRACVELVEDLALAGILDFGEGLNAAMEFISNYDFSVAPDRDAMRKS